MAVVKVQTSFFLCHFAESDTEKILRNLAAIAEAAYKGLYSSMVGRKNDATLPKPGRVKKIQTAKKIHHTSKAAEGHEHWKIAMLVPQLREAQGVPQQAPISCGC